MTSRPATRSVKNSDTIASQRACPSTQIRSSHRLSARQRTDPPPRTQGQNPGAIQPPRTRQQGLPVGQNAGPHPNAPDQWVSRHRRHRGRRSGGLKSRWERQRTRHSSQPEAAARRQVGPGNPVRRDCSVEAASHLCVPLLRIPCSSNASVRARERVSSTTGSTQSTTDHPGKPCCPRDGDN